MKYEIDGLKKGTIIKNYKLKSYYEIKKLKLVKKYHLKINYLKGKSGNLYTTNIEDINDTIKNLEVKMLNQLKKLLEDEEIQKNSSIKYLEKELIKFDIFSSIVTVTMPAFFMIKYNNFFNILLLFPNLLAKLYYKISIGMDYTEIFYRDIEKYHLYLENQKLFEEKIKFININNIDNYDLKIIEESISDCKNEKTLAKRR